MYFASDPFTFQTLSNMIHINFDTKSLWDKFGSWEVSGWSVLSVPTQLTTDTTMACCNTEVKG